MTHSKTAVMNKNIGPNISLRRRKKKEKKKKQNFIMKKNQVYNLVLSAPKLHLTRQYILKMLILVL